MRTTLGQFRRGPRLRAAVAASVAWYDDVFAALRIPVARRGRTVGRGRSSPPYHSAVKTLVPGVATEDVMPAMTPFDHGTVADSFGDQDLAPHGFDLLIDATWLPSRLDGAMPAGWRVRGRTVDRRRPDPPADDLPGPPRRRRPGRRRGVPTTPRRRGRCHQRWNASWTDVVAAAGTGAPGRDPSTHAAGDDLAAALDAGFAASVRSGVAPLTGRAC